ncbi:polysaccharide deacetylase family protein [uncultured Fibrobacter sp.]|uniref:polysaccharide deacetylase family protein n=1 Tax=uncultured Fibrobacter sp. TaxID=261512 RepID=UPI0025ED1CA4|nr:polysaccharide deacetylase family protein [uncultured Fibrobacter sp.]
MASKFLLCFHDFSVWNYRKVTPILEELRDLAGAPFSVLVIPDTEKASPEAVQGFRETLLQLKNEGFELALHGYKHRAEFSQGRSYMGLIGMNLTHGEAEFAGLSEYESSRLLQAGLDAWHNLFGDSEKGTSQNPVAFVPPTWYSNAYLPSQVHAAKMLYEDRWSLTSARGRRYLSPVVSFAGIPKALENLAFAWGRMMFKCPIGVARLVIHPSDFPRLGDKIHDLVRIGLGAQRKLALYKDL